MRTAMIGYGAAPGSSSLNFSWPSAAQCPAHRESQAATSGFVRDGRRGRLGRRAVGSTGQPVSASVTSRRLRPGSRSSPIAHNHPIVSRSPPLQPAKRNRAPPPQHHQTDDTQIHQYQANDQASDHHDSINLDAQAVHSEGHAPQRGSPTKALRFVNRTRRAVGQVTGGTPTAFSTTSWNQAALARHDGVLPNPHRGETAGLDRLGVDPRARTCVQPRGTRRSSSYSRSTGCGGNDVRLIRSVGRQPSFS